MIVLFNVLRFAIVVLLLLAGFILWRIGDIMK